MLAISTLGTTPTAILYIASFAAFVLAGIGMNLGTKVSNLVAVGLALYVFVQAWNALAAT